MSDLPDFLTPPEAPRLPDVRRWAVREAALDNGLRVRLLEDHALPVCAMHTFFGVGSRDERPGQTGVSHLLEHMMFNGTPRVGPRMFDQLLESQGGQSNAFTSRDMTAYENDFAASALDCVLRLESDRLAGLSLAPEVLRAELDVVLEERRISTEESIGGRLDEALYALAFDVHPYRAPVIGWQRDLERLDRAACLAHFRAHYAPDNAAIWIAGDFDSAAVLEKIRALYGPIAPAGRAKAIYPREPAQRAERRAEITFPAHSEALIVGYKAPPARAPEAPIAELLSFLLSAGPGARLVRRLVFEEQVAVSAGAEFAWLDAPGLFTLQLDLPPGTCAEAALERLDRLLDEICAQGFAHAELEQAKAEWRAQFLRALSTCHGRCELFGMNEQLLGDWRATFSMARAIAAATPEEVRAVAAALFCREQRSTVILRPGARSQAPLPLAEVDAEAEVEIEVRRAAKVDIEVDADADVDAQAAALPAEFMKALPALEPGQRLPIPAFVDRDLANGMRVSAACQDAVPLFSLCLSFGAGSAHEPLDKPGLADFAMELLRRGTARLDATALDAALARLGCALGVETGLETVSLVASAPAESLLPVIELVAELVRRPAFAVEEIAAARERAVARLSIELDEPSIVVHEALCRAAFGAHPYGRSGRGTPGSVQGFTRADVAQMAALILAPERAVLTIAGDVQPERALAAAERCFGGWPRGGRDIPAIEAPPELFGDSILIADMPGSEQAQVVLASRAPGKLARDHFAATLAAYVLGGGFSSRLVEAVRVSRGLSYGLSCSVSGGLLSGLFAVGSFTKNETLRELIDVVREEASRFRNTGPTAEELERARRSLCGLLPMGLESSGQIARAFNDVLRLNRPRDFLERSVERVLSVDAARLQDGARRYFLVGGTRIAVAGDAGALAPRLASLCPVEVISLDALSRAPQAMNIASP